VHDRIFGRLETSLMQSEKEDCEKRRKMVTGNAKEEKTQRRKKEKEKDCPLLPHQPTTSPSFYPFPRPPALPPRPPLCFFPPLPPTPPSSPLIISPILSSFCHRLLQFSLVIDQRLVGCACACGVTSSPLVSPTSDSIPPERTLLRGATYK